MRKLFVVLSVVALAAACSPRHPGTLTWTVDGNDAADACGDLADTMNIKVFPYTSVNAEMGDPVEETSADCTAGTADIALGNYSTIFVEAKKGEDVVGLGGPLNVQAQGGLVGSLNPLTGALQVDVDVAIEIGFLNVSFTVAQGSCEDAGVGELEVMLYKQLVSLDREQVWEEPMTTTCADGITIEGVEVGSTYNIEVMGDAGGTMIGTAFPGHRVNVRQAGIATNINLIELDPLSDPPPDAEE
jgi:hypothetical protein